MILIFLFLKKTWEKTWEKTGSIRSGHRTISHMIRVGSPHCWWKKSCTTWHVWNPVKNEISHIYHINRWSPDFWTINSTMFPWTYPAGNYTNILSHRKGSSENHLSSKVPAPVGDMWVPGRVCAAKHKLVGGWTNPFEKICSSKWESVFQAGMKTKIDLKFHHLVNQGQPSIFAQGYLKKKTLNQLPDPMCTNLQGGFIFWLLCSQICQAQRGIPWVGGSSLRRCDRLHFGPFQRGKNQGEPPNF